MLVVMARLATFGIWALAGLLPLAGCGGGDDEPRVVEALPFETVLAAAFSGVDAVRQVAVNDDAAWAALWTAHTSNVDPAPARPAVDFRTRTVAAVFLGQSVACQRPEIAAVERTDANTVRVSYRIQGPGPAELCPAVVMTPVHIVSFANAARLPVEFRQLAPS